TLAVRLQENARPVLEDLQALVEHMAPVGAQHRHNDFSIRTEHIQPHETLNYHWPSLHLLLGASKSVPRLRRQLQLGPSERLFPAVELDGPRSSRHVLVQTLGPVDPTPIGGDL